MHKAEKDAEERNARMIEQQIKEARRLEQEFKGSVEDDKTQEVVPLSIWMMLDVRLLMWVLVCGCGGPHAVQPAPAELKLDTSAPAVVFSLSGPTASSVSASGAATSAGSSSSTALHLPSRMGANLGLSSDKKKLPSHKISLDDMTAAAATGASASVSHGPDGDQDSSSSNYVAPAGASHDPPAGSSSSTSKRSRWGSAAAAAADDTADGGGVTPMSISSAGPNGSSTSHDQTSSSARSKRQRSSRSRSRSPDHKRGAAPAGDSSKRAAQAHHVVDQRASKQPRKESELERLMREDQERKVWLTVGCCA